MSTVFNILMLFFLLSMLGGLLRKLSPMKWFKGTLSKRRTLKQQNRTMDEINNAFNSALHDVKNCLEVMQIAEGKRNIERDMGKTDTMENTKSILLVKRDKTNEAINDWVVRNAFNKAQSTMRLLHVNSGNYLKADPVRLIYLVFTHADVAMKFCRTCSVKYGRAPLECKAYAVLKALEHLMWEDNNNNPMKGEFDD